MHELKKTFEADGTQYQIYQLTPVTTDPPLKPVWCEIVSSAGEARTVLLFSRRGGWRSIAAPAVHPEHARSFADDVNRGAIKLS